MQEEMKPDVRRKDRDMAMTIVVAGDDMKIKASCSVQRSCQLGQLMGLDMLKNIGRTIKVDMLQCGAG
ncbi:hypothetical protein NC00_14445 [Xanthomonas cannabis pv. phaseoli]|uniref:Uncharacterized protein n=1 Tax=Xanthomonas cannabis pv. phaseoli TaxID=1885902 RepID=A0AB34P698_9XANT|nr:hypothetical protein NC00_14445 [Xanthomonas cannabis pv. phaseoli]